MTKYCASILNQQHAGRMDGVRNQDDETSRVFSECLRLGEIEPRLLYLSALQSRRWLNVNQRWAPFLNSEDCRRVYTESSRHLGRAFGGGAVVVGMGCGNGQKDRVLLEVMASKGQTVHFVPVDCSADLVSQAEHSARQTVDPSNVHPVVGDLHALHGFRSTLDGIVGTSLPRVFTFYGMIPNLAPDVAGRRLRSWLRPGDALLFSANLLPDDSPECLTRILEQYDNRETREWLLTLLEENGVAVDDRALQMAWERDAGFPEFQRIVADYRFPEETRFSDPAGGVVFSAGSKLRLFFSQRYTAGQVAELLEQYGMRVESNWLTQNSEEGVFACRLQG